MQTPAPIGTRVYHTERHEHGVIEEYRSKDGEPLVRYDYGNLLHASLRYLEVVCEKS